MATSWPLEGGSGQWPVFRGSEAHVADGQLAAVDLGLDRGVGTRWLAIADGTCINLDDNPDAGWFVDVEFEWEGASLIARYCHANSNDDLLVQIGQSVVAGQPIGHVGCRGFVLPSAKPVNSHLHLWLRRPNGTRVPPEAVLDVIAGSAPRRRVAETSRRAATPSDSLIGSIQAYVASRPDAIGRPVDNGGGSGIHQWGDQFVQDFEGLDESARSTAGRLPGWVTVVAGPNGPKLLRNAFYDQYLRQLGNAPFITALGPPLDDEAPEEGHVVQHFVKGRMEWNGITGVTVFRGG